MIVDQLPVHQDPRPRQSHGSTLALLVQQQQVRSGEVVVPPLGQDLLHLLTSLAVVHRHLSHAVVIQYVSLSDTTDRP